MILFLYSLIALFLYAIPAQADFDPIAVYLTWQRHPESTMTICWITNLEREDDIVQYRRKGEKEWMSAVGKHLPMPDHYPFWIHSIELVHLQSDMEYTFRISPEGVPYRFRTLSKDSSKPLRFLVGGDVYHDGLKILEKMNRQAAKLDPMFAIVGGDLAYNDDKSSSLPHLMPRWMDWLIAWKNQMVTPDGRLIPLIPALGNHDVKKRKNQKLPPISPFFYALFPFPGPQGFNVIDFGDRMSLIILDSGHTHPVDGTQTEWLRHTLEKRKQVLHKFVVYHVGAYPCVRSFWGTTNEKIRKQWVPLFEKFDVNAVFEHHDHAYKRTWPLREGKIDHLNGVLYLGDGAWGVEAPRKPKKMWYLAKTQASRHVLLTYVHGNQSHFLAINDLGEVIDEVMSQKSKNAFPVEIHDSF